MSQVSDHNLYLRYVKAPESRTLVTRNLGSGSIGISRTRCDIENFGMLDPPEREDAYLVFLRLTDTKEDVWVNERHHVPIMAQKGFSGIIDYRQHCRIHAHKPFDTLNFHLPHSALLALEGAERNRSITELKAGPQDCFDDPMIRGLSDAILPALERPEIVNALFVDHIGWAFAAYISKTYGHTLPRVTRVPRRLSPWQQRRALEMIDANLGNDLRLADLAEACGLSLGHFAHAFRQTMAMPPHRWLLRRRVERAQALMVDSNLTLAEIALRSGFADQSHLTRVFRNTIGVPPSVWRRHHARGPSPR
ncbi:AraC family transcriptional regulator [Polyangium aurulentum]|uniref:AraC family transcriptional regulator n=1 Tax=Polyangium aurulentum TaxID=2567896 RepID=UPI0010ADD857|nr:AraC family transcriptional regulator [Polyangium aurulentum]UQA55466.1 AraC family transcriptional regulator [Polyangium aurulentum]